MFVGVGFLKKELLFGSLSFFIFPLLPPCSPELDCFRVKLGALHHAAARGYQIFNRVSGVSPTLSGMKRCSVT